MHRLESNHLIENLLKKQPPACFNYTFFIEELRLFINYEQKKPFACFEHNCSFYKSSLSK